jgi:hypothetical protein
MLAQGLSKGTERFGTAPFDHPAATPRRRNPARWSRNGAPAERWPHRRRFGVPRSSRAVPGLAGRSEGTREIRVSSAPLVADERYVFSQGRGEETSKPCPNRLS